MSEWYLLTLNRKGQLSQSSQSQTYNKGNKIEEKTLKYVREESAITDKDSWCCRSAYLSRTHSVGKFKQHNISFVASGCVFC